MNIHRNSFLGGAAGVRRATGAVLLSVTAALSVVGVQAMAATYAGPTQAPPGGNIPVTIWNRLSSSSLQTNAAIAIDGGGATMGSFVGLSVGTSSTDLGAAAAGQNLIYGIADYAKMNAGDRLFLLQTNSGGVVSDRFAVDQGGSTSVGGNLVVSGATAVGGTASFGRANLDLGSAAPGQNVIYGLALYDGMNAAGDDLLKLQTVDDTLFTDRLTVNRDGDVETPGRVHGTGCVGHVFVGLTSAAYTPAAIVAAGGGYNKVNGYCNADYAGAHVCRPEEVLESYACARSGDPILSTAVIPDETAAFLVGGPPGYKALANDCNGWTMSASTALGRIWFFNSVTGGRGSQTQCDITDGIKFACCR